MVCTHNLQDLLKHWVQWNSDVCIVSCFCSHCSLGSLCFSFVTCHFGWKDKSGVFGPEVKLAGGTDASTRLVVERACGLHVSTADSATWVGYHKEYLLIRVIHPFATRINLWNGGARQSLRPRIRQQGKIRIRVDRLMCALLCTSAGRRVWVGYLP